MDDLQVQSSNEFLEAILFCIKDEVLDERIKSTQSYSELVTLLEIKFEKLQRKVPGSCRISFDLSRIFAKEGCCNLKKIALTLGLQVQADNRQFIECLCELNRRLQSLEYINEWDSAFDSQDAYCVVQIIWVAAAIIEVKNKYQSSIFDFVNMDNMTKFLLKLCTFQLSENVYIDKHTLFLKYLEIILLRDRKFIDESIQYFIDHDDSDFIYLLFKKNFNSFSTCEIFQEEKFWDFIRINIVNNNTVKKNQAEYILSFTVEHLKTQIPKVLQCKSSKDWDYFFILLSMSKEKQLHLILPTLKLLPSITNLHITWQYCLYQELLKHSQLTVVYRVIQHILKMEFSCNKINKEILGDVLVALNKYEYSDFSQEAFSELEIFCNKLQEDYYTSFFEEFVQIEWNPAAAWSVLKCTSKILSECPKELIFKMLILLERLPHTFIKQSCIIFFIHRILDNPSDFLDKVTIIGKYLISTNQQWVKNVFHDIIEEKKDELSKCCEKLEEEVLKATQNKDLECLKIYSDLTGIFKKDVLKCKEIPVSECGDLIFLHLCTHDLQAPDLDTYITKRFENISACNNQYFFKLLEMLFDKNLMKIPSDKCLDILHSCESEIQEFYASYLIYRLQKDVAYDFDSTIIERVETKLKLHKYNLNGSWMSSFRQRFVMKDQECNTIDIDKFYKKFQLLLGTESEHDLMIAIDNLDLLVKYNNHNEQKFVELLDLCLRKLCTLPKNFMKKFAAILFQSIFKKNLFLIQSFIECWKKWHLELFDRYFMDYDELVEIILSGCLKNISLGIPDYRIIIKFLLDSLTKGSVIQKNERVEYGICQEIHDNVQCSYLKNLNPNLIASNIKHTSLLCLQKLAHESVQSADGIMEMLMNLYMENYKKRYFPNSKLHLDKLRIIQAMLLIVRDIDKSKEKLVKFIMMSFCEESHQKSVMQLLQMLLQILVIKEPKNLKLLIQKLENSNSSNPSCVLALIPVIQQLLVSLKDERYWFEATEHLLPWTMGSNFKLRVGSQLALRNISKKARELNMINYINKYSFLEKSFETVLNADENSTLESLMNEFGVFFKVSLDKCDAGYSVVDVLVSVPKMLGVQPSEWQNLEHKLSNKKETMISIVTYEENINNENDNVNSDVLSSVIVQKKIVPWKRNLDPETDKKSLSDLICVASLIENHNSIGGLSRTCEIFNVRQLVLHDIKIIDNKEFQSLSVSSKNWIDISEVKKNDLSKYLAEMGKKGYSLVGLEQTSESVMLNEYKFNKKTVILLGHEKEGIPAYLLPLLDSCVEIPQFGHTSSLNIHVAGANCIWEYAKQHMV